MDTQKSLYDNHNDYETNIVSETVLILQTAELSIVIEEITASVPIFRFEILLLKVLR